MNSYWKDSNLAASCATILLHMLSKKNHEHITKCPTLLERVLQDNMNAASIDKVQSMKVITAWIEGGRR